MKHELFPLSTNNPCSLTLGPVVPCAPPVSFTLACKAVSRTPQIPIIDPVGTTPEQMNLVKCSYILTCISCIFAKRRPRLSCVSVSITGTYWSLNISDLPAYSIERTPHSLCPCHYSVNYVRQVQDPRTQFLLLLVSSHHSVHPVDSHSLQPSSPFICTCDLVHHIHHCEPWTNNFGACPCLSFSWLVGVLLRYVAWSVRFTCESLMPLQSFASFCLFVSSPFCSKLQIIMCQSFTM